MGDLLPSLKEEAVWWLTQDPATRQHPFSIFILFFYLLNATNYLVLTLLLTYYCTTKKKKLLRGFLLLLLPWWDSSDHFHYAIDDLKYRLNRSCASISC